VVLIAAVWRVQWKSKRIGGKPPVSRWLLEGLAVTVVAITGHLGGFLSGVNHHSVVPATFSGTSLTKAPYLRLIIHMGCVSKSRRTVAMRKIFLSLFVAGLACTAFAAFAGADDWSKTYDLTGKPELRVQTHDANLRIETWDQNMIEAHLTTQGWHIGNGGLEIVEHQQGNTVDLELRQPHRAHFSIGIDARRVELEIRMPRSAKITVRSADGNVSAKGLEGELNFTTGDGRLQLEDVEGSLRAHTSDGSVRVSGRFDVLELRTSDGRVDVEARPGSHLLEPWDIRSSDGSVTLRIPGDLAADVELHTSDGSITTNIPLVVEGSFRSHDIHGKMNGGGNRLTIHTSDGSVTLDKL